MSALLQVIPILMVLAAPVARRSVVCTEPDAPRVLHVQIYNQTTLTRAEVNSIVEVTNRLWSRYGVSLDLGPGPDELAVVLQVRSSSTLSDSQPMVLGSTLFTGGHATPYINLSMPHSEALARELEFDGPSFVNRPESERLAIVARILGVALAHEVAHYVLDQAGHVPTGLLQKSLKPRVFVDADPAVLRLTRDQQSQLCPAPPRGGSR